MTDTTTLQAELHELHQRRAALATQADDARATLAEAHDKLLLASDKRAVEAATAAQARVAMFTEALSTLDEQIAAHRDELTKAEAATRREARINLLLQHAGQADAARHDYEGAQLELNEHLKRLVARMVEAKRRWRTAQESWLDEAKQLAAGVSLHAVMRRDQIRDEGEMEREAEALIAELEGRGADMDAVLAEDVTWHRLLAITRRYPVGNVEPFGRDIDNLVSRGVDPDALLLSRERARAARQQKAA